MYAAIEWKMKNEKMYDFFFYNWLYRYSTRRDDERQKV